MEPMVATDALDLSLPIVTLPPETRPSLISLAPAPVKPKIPEPPEIVPAVMLAMLPLVVNLPLSKAVRSNEAIVLPAAATTLTVPKAEPSLMASLPPEVILKLSAAAEPSKVTVPMLPLSTTPAVFVEPSEEDTRLRLPELCFKLVSFCVAAFWK